jgi:hypothetical protein
MRRSVAPQLDGVYTQALNGRHGRVEHALQGHFKAILVHQDNYLLELCGRILLNPVRGKLIRKAYTYRWSSYRATAGLGPRPAYLSVD